MASFEILNMKIKKMKEEIDYIKEGCPIYPHRVESSVVSIDSIHRKSSGVGLSVKYTKDLG